MNDMGNCQFCDNGYTHEMIGHEATDYMCCRDKAIFICSDEDCYISGLDYLDFDEPELIPLYF